MGDVRGLVQTTRGFVLVSPDGVTALSSAMRGGDFELPDADAWSRMTGRGKRPRHRAEALIRRYAVDRCPPWGLRATAQRHGVQTYINVGHSNHSLRVLGPIKQTGARVVVLIHDLVPITHPDLVPPEQPSRFAQRLACIRDHADLVIAVSEDTKMALAGHWRDASNIPPIVSSEIGVPGPVHAFPPTKPASGRFLMVGTLEPRKNHALILKAWTALADALPPKHTPRLDIIGQPGWRGAEIAGDIQAHPQYGKTLFLNTAATDETRDAAFQAADTLLYPSLAEGFGLPPYEALAHGLLPICSDLPALRSGLGLDVVYLDSTGVYHWVEAIKKRTMGDLKGPERRSAQAPT